MSSAYVARCLIAWLALVVFSLPVVVFPQQPELALPNQSGNSESAEENGLAEQPQAEESSKTTDFTHGQLQQLLRGLDAREFQQRTQAESEIIQLGPAVLPFLPSVTPQTSGEMRLRLQRIRQSLESQVREGFFQASRVTIQGSKPISEVLQEIAEQSNNAIRIQGEPEAAGRTQVVFDWNETPFWLAIGELMNEAELRLVPFSSSSNELVLGPRLLQNPVQPSMHGAFRIEVSSVQSERNFDSRLEGQLRIGLVLSWEPRLEPLFMQLPMNTFSAEDDRGEIHIATNPQAAPEVRLNVGGCSTQIEVQLNLPSRQAKLLKNLSGTFLVAVPGDRHEYVFEDISSGMRQVQQFGDVTVTLEGARRNGPVYETRLFVKFGDPAGALESFRGWITSNRAFLTDEAGAVLENVGFQTYAASGNGIGVSYLFQIDKQPEQYRLSYESPSSVAKQAIEFQLEDVPLP